MNQEESLRGIEKLDRHLEDRGKQPRAHPVRWIAKACEEPDVRKVSKALLRALRNGRVERMWRVAGGPGSGAYYYGVTEKGLRWLDWLDGVTEPEGQGEVGEPEFDARSASGWAGPSIPFPR